MANKRRVWIIVGVVAVLAIVGGYLVYSNGQTAAAQEDTTEVQTSTVRTGSITVSATGAGTVIPARQVDLAFSTSGVLTELAVGVGDQVTTGDELARINDTTAQHALATAQLQVTQAAMQTDATATQTGISFDDISIEEAQMTLDEAQAALDELVNWTADEEEIALLQAKLDAAEASYSAAQGQDSASSTNVDVEAISLEQTKRALAEAQDAYNVAHDPGRDWELNDPRTSDALEAERDRTADSLLRAQEALEVAELNYQATVSSTNYSSSASAQSNLVSAQQELATAQAGPTADEIAAAQTTVRTAELALKQAQLNQEANALSLQQAQLSLQSAQADVDGTVLTAPFDGVITAINYNVGENASGAVMTLADMSQPLLEVYLDESDLNMIGLGYQVEVSFDALVDQVFTGTVTQIDPTLVTSNGVSVVRALVQLDESSFAKPQTLPAGLNATVEVIGGKAENALLVPVEALREISDGQYAVFVMVDGVPELRMVEVGLMDYSFAEILSGVAEGDVVTTGVVETNSATDTGTSDSQAPSFEGGAPVDGGVPVEPPAGGGF
ncbi:MAG: efflux RND transporter periplasmic adaptor subunit [Candidatus Promineofilum sp.]|nr:efflux RND transporter periplasmic adaptor subunit [Promineifilum sp.]MCW5865455.1 HlyD family efflux transporter periplasmic adaptor subunit [Anaerolineae bacterium]